MSFELVGSNPVGGIAHENVSSFRLPRFSKTEKILGIVLPIFAGVATGGIGFLVLGKFTLILAGTSLCVSALAALIAIVSLVVKHPYHDYIRKKAETSTSAVTDATAAVLAETSISAVTDATAAALAETSTSAVTDATAAALAEARARVTASQEALNQQ